MQEKGRSSGEWNNCYTQGIERAASGEIPLQNKDFL